MVTDSDSNWYFLAIGSKKTSVADVVCFLQGRGQATGGDSETSYRHPR